MTIQVCPLSKAAALVDAFRPQRTVSVLDPEYDTPNFGPGYVNRHLRLSFHDIHGPVSGQVMPSEENVRALLHFLSGVNRRSELLVHCRAGIGRSTATAYIAACYRNPDIDEGMIASCLRGRSTSARPNEVLVGLADDVMGRNGRMIRAITETGTGAEPPDGGEGEPFQLPADYAWEESGPIRDDTASD